MQRRRWHMKHLGRCEWKGPINNTNTTSNSQKKEAVTTDARHNIRFRKLILGDDSEGCKLIMPYTPFKIITVGPCTNGSPLSQAGVYQFAVPAPQMKGKKSLLSHYCGSGSGSLEARGTCLLAGITRTPIKAFQSATWQC